MSDTTTTDLDYDIATGEVIDETPADAGALVIQDAISRLQSGSSNVYSTVQGDDFDTKLKVMTAVTSAEPLKRHLEEHIDLENIVVQPVQLEQRDANGNGTGIKITQPRTILLDVNGKAYYTVSPVVLKDIETITGVLGAPSTWPAGGVGVKAVEGKARAGAFYHLVLDHNPKKK